MTTDTPDDTVAPGVDPGLNYVALREEGIRLVQKMSGNIWTDYNFSDPGVTILEQLCYALTELSYRANNPVADLLCDPESGRVRLNRAGLYPARAILPVNPVTIDDFRRILIDRVSGLANAWLAPCPIAQTNGVNGLYDIWLLVSQQDPCCRTAHYDPEKVRNDALKVYAAHRALCEDVEHIRVLRLLTTRVFARIQLDDSADAAQVLANLFFRIGMLFAPEPKRCSLDELLAEGRSTTEIFAGPMMLNGFIEDDQLTPFPGAIEVGDVLRVIASTKGVVAARDLSIQIEGDPKIYVPGDTIAVPKDSILWLETAAQAGRFTIRLFRGAVECKPDAERVTRLLDAEWAAQRKTYPLAVEYAAHYGPQKGRVQNLAAYTSVQDQFPNVYGINAYGLPEYARAPRRGQAKQLKGYLMAFDQLMADYFAQLAFIRDLFSIRAGGNRTYAVQSLRPIVPDVEPLLKRDYMEGLLAITAAADPVVARQSAIIDLLLSLYAERLNLPPQSGCDCGNESETVETLLRAKQLLLARTVPATRERGRGFDYLELLRRTNIAGMEIRTRIELGLVDVASTSNGRDALEVVANAEEASFGRPLTPDQGAAVAQAFLPVGDVSGALGTLGEDDVSPFAGKRVAETLLGALAHAENYRIGIEPGDSRVDLVCRDDANVWWLLGRYGGTAEALAAIARLMRAADRGQMRHQLYLVEHVLLRFAQLYEPKKDNYYSFRMSAVIATYGNEADDAVWRGEVQAILRQNSPAHVAVECLFLDRESMRHFLRLYRQWCLALREGPAHRRAATSRELEMFLKSQDHPPVNGAKPAPNQG